jgi:XapX domain-containing protein
MLSVALSLIAGLVVGIGYALCGIRSPAPPAIALLGLLGMLAGEHGTVLALRHFGVRPYEPAPIETLAHPLGDRTPQTLGG